jgi:hypothetical protein
MTNEKQRNEKGRKEISNSEYPMLNVEVKAEEVESISSLFAFGLRLLALGCICLQLAACSVKLTADLYSP